MNPPKASKLYKVLNATWKYPIVVLVKGGWRQGKTSSALLMAYLSKKWGLIDRIASNIWTWNHPDVEYVISLQGMQRWLHSDKSRKLFLLDEALKHMYRRHAMSKKNIAMITEILPEVSKGHGRIAIISQIDKIDSDILDPVFCRSVWEKRGKKRMICMSKHHKTVTFENLPDSPIRFDPDRLALFLNKDVSKKKDLGDQDEIYQVASYYGSGKSTTWIKREMNIHQEKVKRLIRKALQGYIQNVDSETAEGVKPPESAEPVTPPPTS